MLTVNYSSVDYYYVPVGVQTIAISLSVCMSVCLSVCPHFLKKQSTLHAFLCTRYLWPWLDPLLTTMQYIMYFRFCVWRNISRNGYYLHQTTITTDRGFDSVAAALSSRATWWMALKKLRTGGFSDTSTNVLFSCSAWFLRPLRRAVPTVHQDNNRKARFPLHSTSHLELAATDSSGQWHCNLFEIYAKDSPLLSGFPSYSYRSLTHYLAQAPLKLRPYGAMQICLLL